jgi:hypothetical protein
VYVSSRRPASSKRPVSGLTRIVTIGLAAIIVAAVLGGGVPLAWLWIASRIQPVGGQGIDPLAALVLIAGTIGTYVAIGLIGNRAPGSRQPRRGADSWNRSLSEDRNPKRTTTAVEQVFIVATLIVAAAFELWLLMFAHQTPWGG